MNQQELNNKLEQIKEKLISIEQKAGNQVFLNCEAENSFAVNKFLLEDVGARFCIETGIDADNCFEVIYHYSYDGTGCVINIKAFIRDRVRPSIESVARMLPAAEWIEREIHDLFGIEFKNHPDMRRLILSDDWPDGLYPLRKAASEQRRREIKK